MNVDTEIETLWRQLTHGQSLAVDEATTWTVVPGFFGSGTILVGPANGATTGTVAVVPPGVWARNPDGDENPLTREGWRLYRWAPHRLIDEHRPLEVRELTLEQVSTFLEECEPGLLWTQRLVRAQIRILRSLTQVEAGSGCSVAEREAAAADARALEAQAIAAFGQALPSEPAGRSLKDLAQAWPEAELQRDRLRATPASMDGSFEVDLSEQDRSALWDAAHEVVKYDLATEADQFVIEAQTQAGCLSEDLRRQLLRFRRFGSPLGGLLITGMPIGDVPPTPRHADYGFGTRLLGAAAMSVVVAVLGDQFGFRPELGGNIVQDIVPVRGFEDTQQSISSSTALTYHVDKAFSENRSDYLCILCLRPDHDGVAGTTLSSMHAIFPLLDRRTVGVLGEHRFKTSVDGSFLRGAGIDEPIWIEPIRVLSGDAKQPCLRADFAETHGTDREAQLALDRLAEAAREVSVTVHLKAGDLLVIDNRGCLSGRTSFTARWDGNDRWLLRTFITNDLARSAAQRPGDGRIIDADYSHGAQPVPGLTRV